MPSPPPGPPSAWTTAGEALAGLEVFRLGVKTPMLRSIPHGDGAPVILTPGLGATDRSLLPLRHFLRDKGHHVRSANLGRIDTNVAELVRLLLDRTTALNAQRGRRVSLVGWSMGGVLSREIARQRPDLVERVITFGTPVIGGPSRRPIRVPVTAIWSRRDGVVSPRACIDHDSPDVENLEVSSTHIGMGIDPDVWSIVARRLLPKSGS